MRSQCGGPLTRLGLDRTACTRRWTAGQRVSAAALLGARGAGTLQLLRFLHRNGRQIICDLSTKSSWSLVFSLYREIPRENSTVSFILTCTVDLSMRAECMHEK